MTDLRIVKLELSMWMAPEGPSWELELAGYRQGDRTPIQWNAWDDQTDALGAAVLVAVGAFVDTAAGIGRHFDLGEEQGVTLGRRGAHAPRH